MRLSISTRIFLGFAAVLTVFGLVSTFAVWRMHRIGQEIRLVSDGYLPLTKVAAQLETFHKNRQRDTDRLLDEADPRTQRILIKLARLYFPRIVREKLGQGRSLVAAARGLGAEEEEAFLDGIDARLREIATSYDEYDSLAETLFAQIEGGGAGAPATEAAGTATVPTAVERGKELKRIERRIDRELRLLGHDLDVRVRERVWEAQRLERSSSWGIIGFALGAILLGLAATLMSQRLLAPIRTLTQAAVRIGRGDYAAEVPTDAGNEVGVLAREFNQMAASLAARERELGEKQAALVRAERLAAIGSVAAQITHEIRNPLSSIGLNAELLAEEIPGAERGTEARRLLGSIAREVDRLAEITEEYLRFARLPAPELGPEDVSALLADLVAFVRPEMEAAGIEVRLETPGKLLAMADEGQLRQALLNLARNAREAMAGAGTLTLSARRDGDEVELAVADTGPGIPVEEQSRIFDPFYTTKKRGTGLGLALIQQIVAAHGGTIDLASAPGAGTTFTVRLPGVQTT